MKPRIFLIFAKYFGLLIMLLLVSSFVYGEKIDPPWSNPPTGGINFTVPGIDNVSDLHGEHNNPDLVVFFAGNQFMVVPELIDSFRALYPKNQRIFVETLPPGILAEQIEKGALVIGNLKITVTPDVFTAGEKRINESKAKGWFDEIAPYAKNRLTIMVYKGNPKKVYSLKDLAKPEINVSMPNPKWEGIGENIVKAYNKVGGKKLEEMIRVKKVEDGTTFLTHIHHRQTPMRIMKDESDAGPVWYTEAYFQKMIGNPIDMVEVPTKENIVGTYVAGKLKNAPHQQAAKDFIIFLQSEKAGAIYKKYGFLSIE